MAPPSLTVAPPPPPSSDVGSQFNLYLRVTTSLAVCLAVAIIAAPAAAIGMALSWIVWRITRPAKLTVIVLTVGAAVSFVILAHQVAWLWPIGVFFPGRLYGVLPPSSAAPLGSVIWRSCAIELLLGPSLFVALDALLGFREHTLISGLYRQAPRNAAREGGWGGWRSRWSGDGGRYDSSAVAGSAHALEASHPTGAIRLGVDRDNRRKPFDLTAAELAAHVFIPGASGSGKTTTLARIADGAMQEGYGLVIVDCKGGGLGVTARQLAARHGLPFFAVDPSDPDSLGYNPVTGDAADVANKLLGAFSFGQEGEIYKQVAMRGIPPIVRGLMAANKPVTLAAITQACEPNELARLARQVGTEGGEGDEGGELQTELLQLAAAEGIGKAGMASLEFRFGALLQGKFGDLFRKSPALDWDAVLAKPSVVYVSLSATAASEDVELMGRVVAQDLKQLCGRRLRVAQEGKSVTPVIVAFDEFAALREAEQITDLLLQARQAEMPVLLSTQYLPEAIPIRKAALSAGLLVVHRLESQDAEDVAAQWGTQNRWKVTYQTNWESGETEKGSIRTVDEFVIHPNVLRSLDLGEVAVRSVSTKRHAIVKVFPVEKDTLIGP